ncbi:hypothetical protein K3Z87_20280, partial [Pseudomonas aeruginosa]|nr:hypothetical protein [Pseudomonas aeruginosa]
MGMRTVLTGLAGMLLGSMMPVQADMPRPTGLAADIRWTAYGVPHIRAKDERRPLFGSPSPLGVPAQTFVVHGELSAAQT